MGLEADAGTILKIAGDAGGCDDDGDASVYGSMRIEGDAGGGDGDYGKSGTSGPDGMDLDLGGRETPALATATAAKTAVWVWRPTLGPFRKSKGALVIVAQPRPHMHRYPERPAVPLRNEDKTKHMLDAGVQHWSDERLKRDMLPARMRLGLRALRTELACVCAPLSHELGRRRRAATAGLMRKRPMDQNGPAGRTAASSRCDRSSLFESYTDFVRLYSRARPARACSVLTRSAPPPPALPIPVLGSHMSRPGPLYPRTPHPHSLDHGATGTLTPCEALNMGLAWWLQEGSTSDTNSDPTLRVRVNAHGSDRTGRTDSNWERVHCDTAQAYGPRVTKCIPTTGRWRRRIIYTITVWCHQ